MKELGQMLILCSMKHQTLIKKKTIVQNVYITS